MVVYRRKRALSVLEVFFRDTYRVSFPSHLATTMASNAMAMENGIELIKSRKLSVSIESNLFLKPSHLRKKGFIS